MIPSPAGITAAPGGRAEIISVETWPIASRAGRVRRPRAQKTSRGVRRGGGGGGAAGSAGRRAARGPAAIERRAAIRSAFSGQSVPRAIRIGTLSRVANPAKCPIARSRSATTKPVRPSPATLIVGRGGSKPTKPGRRAPAPKVAGPGMPPIASRPQAAIASRASIAARPSRASLPTAPKGAVRMTELDEVLTKPRWLTS